MIPKIIHYCWYGRGEFSPLVEACIASWKKYCPNYEFKRWDESNSPMEMPWIRDAYKHQKYAFVADYMRFYALYNEGGIYLDTDMLLIKSLDEFVNHKAFIGREDAYNASMGIIGAEHGNEFCKMCLDYYDSTKFNMVSPPIITRFISPLLCKYGFKEEDITQSLSNNLVVYKSDYFYPIHYTTKFELDELQRFVTNNTHAIHLWNKSWTDEFRVLEQGDYKKGFLLVKERLIRTPILPIKYYKKVFKYWIKWIINSKKCSK